MKKYFFLLVIILNVSCQVTETLYMNSDGSGSIEVSDLRNENSYIQLAKENYSKEDIYKDTTYTFKDYFHKYSETFARTPKEDQNVYLRYSNVKVHIKKSSYDKEFQTTVSQNFNKVAEIVDLYKAEDYADNIKKNYALAAEEHYYKISYEYVGNRFSRMVKITDSIQLKKEFDQIEKIKENYRDNKVVQNYVLKYHFPRKIQSVSNPLAKISDDYKSLSLQFLLTDCLQNPSSTSLEVILEPETVD